MYIMLSVRLFQDPSPRSMTEQLLCIEIVKGRNKHHHPFSAYLLLTTEQRAKLHSSVRTNLNDYEVFYTKFGHEISDRLHSEIMHFFAIKYLNKPIRYIVHDLPLDKE